MKLGIIFGDSNRLLSPGTPERMWYSGSPVSMSVFAKLYPGDDFAYLSSDAPDMDIVSEMDAVIYYAGGHDAAFLEYVDKIKCPVLGMLVGINSYYSSLVSSVFSGVTRTANVLDRCDLVIGVDQFAVDIFSLYTFTPVVYMPIPVPIVLAQEVAATVSDGAWDIVIPYGPHISQIRERNGILTCLIAQRIIDEIPGYNRMAVFNNSHKQHEFDAAERFMRDLGCRDFDLFPYVPYEEFIGVLAGAKLGLDLDICRGTGKFAVDCAVLRKPAILSSMLSYAVAIYSGMAALVHPLDVNAVMGKAKFVADGLWPSCWLDIAFARAQDYSISKAADRLTEAVNSINAA